MKTPLLGWPGQRQLSGGILLLHSGSKTGRGGQRGSNVKGEALVSKALAMACAARLSRAPALFLADSD